MSGQNVNYEIYSPKSTGHRVHSKSHVQGLGLEWAQGRALPIELKICIMSLPGQSFLTRLSWLIFIFCYDNQRLWFLASTLCVFVLQID